MLGSESFSPNDDVHWLVSLKIFCYLGFLQSISLGGKLVSILGRA
jgi:hypothetical protein